MATITTLSNAVGAGTQPSRSLRNMPYVVENTISWSAAVTAKGSALAAADVIEALQIPAQSIVLAAGFEVLTAATGSCTVSLGVTGVTAAAYQPLVIGAADTIDLLIATATTAPTSGEVRVWAVLMNIDGRPARATADREQLA